MNQNDILTTDKYGGGQMSYAFTNKVRRSTLCIAAAGLLVSALMPVFAAAQSSLEQPQTPGGQSLANTTGQCRPTTIKFIGDPDSRSTTSTTFVTIPGAVFNFVQGGTSPSCVIVYFSAAAITSTNAGMYIRATLDNVANAVPASTPFIVNSPNFESRAASFIFPSVAPGSHTLKIQFEATVVGGGSAVELSASNLIVQFAP